MKGNHYAFVDSQNVNLGIRELGWRLDFGRFRNYLKDKYSASRAYLFIGYIKDNENLYVELRNARFTCIFKPTIARGVETKGNCDAELVLQAMIDYPSYDKAIIVTGDEDFYCLAKYLVENDKLERILAPSKLKCSTLLKRLGSHLNFMDDLKDRLDHKKEKTP